MIIKSRMFPHMQLRLLVLILSNTLIASRHRQLLTMWLALVMPKLEHSDIYMKIYYYYWLQ
jgi:hypothetical protein